MVERGELVERLEKAAGPDRELDREIVMQFSPQLRGLPLDDRGRWIHPMDGPIYAEYLTGSLDEAIALVERVLPVMADRIFIQTCKPAKAGFVDDGRFVYFEAATTAIALIIALLKAGETQ